MTATQDAAAAFIARWQGVAASELSTAQSFTIELCQLLGVNKPISLYTTPTPLSYAADLIA